MKKWIITALAALIAGGAGWYWASPLMAMQGLRDASIEGDKQELAERVDFPAIRESLKGQFRAAMMAEMAKDKDNPFAGLGMALAGAIIDPMIDGIVSPSGIKALVEQGRLQNPSEETDVQSSGPEQNWNIKRDGVDRFYATPDVDAGERVPTLVFIRDGFGWQLVDIEMPADVPSDEASGQ